jgi:ribosomal protein L33
MQKPAEAGWGGEMIFSLFGKKPQEDQFVNKLVALRPCPSCGESTYGHGRVIDLINCENCGAVYYIGVKNPVAKFEKVKLRKLA